MITVLKGENIAGHSVTLSIRNAPDDLRVVFVVKWGKLEKESLYNFMEFDCIDEGMRKYASIKRELNAERFNLQDKLVYCRDEGFTPKQAAEFLLSQGYSR